MKYYIFALASSALFVSEALSQSSTTVFTPDLNGGANQTQSTTSSSGQRTELSRSVNGRQVPLQQSDEKVIRQDANGRVTERIVRKYDPNGQLVSTERIVTEMQRVAGGSRTRETSYRGDINGQMQELERRTTNTQVQGQTAHSDTVVERPNINGAFEPAEKQTDVIETRDGSRHEDETVYRRSGNGSFYEATRQVKDQEKTGDKTVDHLAYYEPGVTGAMQLKSQTVSTTTRNANGAEVTEVNIYANSVDGKVQDNAAAQQIKEQQIIERVKSGTTLTETVSVRRPTISDPSRLGDSRKVSETVCKGVFTPQTMQP